MLRIVPFYDTSRKQDRQTVDSRRRVHCRPAVIGLIAEGFGKSGFLYSCALPSIFVLYWCSLRRGRRGRRRGGAGCADGFGGGVGGGCPAGRGDRSLARGPQVRIAEADEAAAELGISRRQVYGLLKRWRAGSGGL
ncbi:helix-turn-helix domain-containing protein [Nonomuraea dietziae]|uniref:helix-turn-helix domain-containing protein n=1 Tax=Nonomuraea dietziae TaxID=65515 RepID=UPI00331D2637